MNVADEIKLLRGLVKDAYMEAWGDCSDMNLRQVHEHEMEGSWHDSDALNAMTEAEGKD